jgi:hypothetical protein
MLSARSTAAHAGALRLPLSNKQLPTVSAPFNFELLYVLQGEKSTAVMPLQVRIKWDIGFAKKRRLNLVRMQFNKTEMPYQS